MLCTYLVLLALAFLVSWLSAPHARGFGTPSGNWVQIVWSHGVFRIGYIRWPISSPSMGRESLVQGTTAALVGSTHARPWYWVRARVGWGLTEAWLTRVHFPQWVPPFALGLAPALILTVSILRRIVRRRLGRCIRCGYNLTGTVSLVCPECGQRKEGCASRKQGI